VLLQEQHWVWRMQVQEADHPCHPDAATIKKRSCYQRSHRIVADPRVAAITTTAWTAIAATRDSISAVLWRIPTGKRSTRATKVSRPSFRADIAPKSFKVAAMRLAHAFTTLRTLIMV